MTTVAIHQPTYLPWMGFFHKLHKCDIFIILDDVQLPKKAGSWVNRTKMLVDGEPRWLTIPINRPSGVQRVNQVVQVDDHWKRQHRDCLHQWYRRAPYYQQFSDALDEMFDSQIKHILSFNLRALDTLLTQIVSSDDKKFVMASSFSVNSLGSNRLVDLIQKVGGTKYICGSGSAGYLDAAVFSKAGIELEYQQFIERERPQLLTERFKNGLSILDSILTAGPEVTYNLITQTQSTSKFTPGI